MNLTPEQREAGKENFRAAMGDLSRRDFLAGGLAAGVVSAGSLGAFYYGYEKAEGRPLRVGAIGTGDEGSVLLGAVTPDYIQVCAISDIRPYNIHRAFHGDYSGEVALKARPGLMAKYGWKTEDEARRHVKVYGDYQELIANAKADGLEGVIIATPLHLHSYVAIAALKAGLHVITEKLMGHSVHECKEMARAAKQAGLHLATGHQRHYNILYHDAMEAIQRGILGDIHYIRAQWHRGNLPGTDSWQQPMPRSCKSDDPQAKKLDEQLVGWKKTLENATGREIDKARAMVAQLEAQIRDETVDATKYGYEAGEIKDPEGKVVYKRPAMEELIRWRLWDRTGGGLMAELGSHQLDAASIFISAMHGGHKQHPLSVAASATRPLFPADRDAEDHVFCLLEFPAPGYDPKDSLLKQRKIGVQYASINGNGYGGYGEIVYGTKGTLILEREKEVMLYRESGPSTVKTGKSGGPTMDTQASGPPQAAAEKGAAADVSRGYTEELQHWAWCIRNPAPENLPRCHPKVAMADAIIALTANKAAREGKRIEFQEAWFDPDSDETPEGEKPDLSRYDKK
jgi:predicted dehydrogenase